MSKTTNTFKTVLAVHTDSNLLMPHIFLNFIYCYNQINDNHNQRIESEAIQSRPNNARMTFMWNVSCIKKVISRYHQEQTYLHQMKQLVDHELPRDSVLERPQSKEMRAPEVKHASSKRHQ